jgi:hypothetical protein
MVKQWVDRILDNEDHDVDKNKILRTLDEWIKYLQDERYKIMMMKDRPTTSVSNDPDDEYEVRPTEQQQMETNTYGDDDWATPSKELDRMDEG